LTPLVFHLIAHTHWDREWYLPAAALRARLVEMLDDLIERLERDPAYRTFLLDGQTVLLEDYLAVRPEREPVVRALVTAGRLQIGPWYILADELIPSGESLVRNLLAGQRDAMRWGGRSAVLYSPDAFGHPAEWPDLAREFEISAGALWRGVALERDLFRWRGPAGGEVLVYHLPPDGYEIGGALPADPKRLPAAWAPVRAALVARAATRQVAVLVGADHHWAYPDLPRLRTLLAELEPDHEVRISRLDEFLAAAGAEAKQLPRVTGELRWSYGYTWTLQGTHGTRAHLKRRNSLAELLLQRVAEPLVALAGAVGDAPDRALLRHAWRMLLRNHFHDSICGTTTDAVAEAMAVRFSSVESLAHETSRRALHRLVGHDPDVAREEPRADSALVLWNPAVRPRGGIAIADLTLFRRDVLVGPPGSRVPRTGPGWRPLALRAADGALLPVQVLGRGAAQRRVDADRHYPDQDEVDVVRVAFHAPMAPGLGIVRLAPAPPGGLTPSGGVSGRGDTLANELLAVSFSPDGGLHLTDRRTGERYDSLLALESTADLGDTYTPYVPADAPVRQSPAPVQVRLLASGPLVGVLEARWTHPGLRGPVRVVARLHAESPLVHVRLELENRAHDHRLRARLPFGLSGDPLLAGTQFTAVERRPLAIDAGLYPAETPAATFPAHRVAAAARGGRGLALLVPGFAELEWTAAGDLLLTLLRATGELSRGDLPTRPGHAGWPQPVPLAQCVGPHAIDLALTPLADEAERRTDRLLTLWEDAFLPLRASWLPATSVRADRRQTALLQPAPADSVELEGDGLVVSAVKPADTQDGIVLRCVNVSDGEVEGRWRFGRPRTRAWRVRADERAFADAPLAEGGRVLPFTAPPGAWVSHRVE
jgi:alpha-mannosidase